MTLTQAHPANARRQSLEMDSRARHIEPLMQVRIVGNQLLDLGVGFVDVFGIAREGYPAKWTDAAAKQRPNVFGNETRNVEGLRDAGIESHLPDVVAVVENRQPHALEAQQILDVLGHRARRGGGGARGILDPPFVPLFDGPALGQIAIDRIMRRGLIGQRIRLDSPLEQRTEHIDNVAEQRHRQRLAAVSWPSRAWSARHSTCAACASM